MEYNFIKDNKYNFWKQQDPQPFDYNTDYKKMQSTTLEMSYLRIGYFLNFINSEELKDFKNWKVCDVGSGNGIFGKICKKIFGYGAEYDLSGDTISKEELESTNWDLIFLTDVLEHYYNIEELFKIKFKYLFLSFPETPDTDSLKELSAWKHFKPNEHIYCLNQYGMKKWFYEHNCEILGCGNPEDLIRKSESRINITTMIIKNNNWSNKC